MPKIQGRNYIPAQAQRGKLRPKVRRTQNQYQPALESYSILSQKQKGPFLRFDITGPNEAFLTKCLFHDGLQNQPVSRAHKSRPDRNHNVDPYCLHTVLDTIYR